MFGTACMMVLSTGNGVNGFTLDPSIGEFILTANNMTIPKKVRTEKGAAIVRWEGRGDNLSIQFSVLLFYRVYIVIFVFIQKYIQSQRI